MEKLKVIFVRHGDFVDYHLTEKGRTQIQRIAAQLKKRSIYPDSVYVSNTIRSRESGFILADIFNPKVAKSLGILGSGVNINVKEYVSEGKFIGPTVVIVSDDDVIERYARELCREFISFKNGEALVVDVTGSSEPYPSEIIKPTRV